MGSVNKVIIVGNLGADPELKYTPSNRALCNLRIATTEVYKNREGQRQENTEWHRVTVWGDQAEYCSKYLQKGRQVYVEGRLQTRSWDDKDGIKRYATDVVSDRVVFIGGRGGDMSAGGAPGGSGGSPGGFLAAAAGVAVGPIEVGATTPVQTRPPHRRLSGVTSRMMTSRFETQESSRPRGVTGTC